MIENEKDAGGHQHGKRRQAHDRSNEPGPGAEWEPHQGHAFAAHVEGCGDEVQRTEQLANAEKTNRSRPENHAPTLARTASRTNRAQWGILRPATKGGSITDKE